MKGGVVVGVVVVLLICVSGFGGVLSQDVEFWSSLSMTNATSSGDGTKDFVLGVQLAFSKYNLGHQGNLTFNILDDGASKQRLIDNTLRIINMSQTNNNKIMGLIYSSGDAAALTVSNMIKSTGKLTLSLSFFWYH